jgi:hypothetical protein
MLLGVRVGTMSERTDERTVESGDDADLDGLGDGETGDVGFDDEDLGVDVDALTGDPDPAASQSDPTASQSDPTAAGSADSDGGGRGFLSRLRPSVGVSNPLPEVPSSGEVLVAFGVVVATMIGGGAIPLIGSLGSLAGMFAGAFALGVASGESRYLELAFAGATAAGLAAFLSSIRLSLIAGVGLPIAAFGAVSGLLAVILGHYFGRDLRDGLTRDVK